MLKLLVARNIFEGLSPHPWITVALLMESTGSTQIDLVDVESLIASFTAMSGNAFTTLLHSSGSSMAEFSLLWKLSNKLPPPPGGLYWNDATAAFKNLFCNMRCTALVDVTLVSCLKPVSVKFLVYGR